MPTRINPCSYLPRRLQIVATLTAFVIFCIVFLGTSNTEDIDRHLEGLPYGPQLQSGAHIVAEGAHHVGEQLHNIPHNLPNLPHVGSPFGLPAHSPPEQSNSSSGETRWYSDWKWLNPFSGTTTEDDRTVLPPLLDRPAIYTYFDPSNRRKDDKSKESEKELLQIWRRAWWAQGFKPLVLGPGEAQNHPQYKLVQMMELGSDLELDVMRWLAWANMGKGIMCNWLAVPMAEHDDATLTFLRRAEFPKLTRYSELGNGLFAGEKKSIEDFVKNALGLKGLNESASVVDALPAWDFDVQNENTGVAFYSSANIKEKYSAIHEKIDKSETRAEGLQELPKLINGHLHSTWQESFSKGIAVLQPHPKSTSKLVSPAMELAQNISKCPISPIASSCPPNRPKCTPCVASKGMEIKTPQGCPNITDIDKNHPKIFTIGTVPHPYTMTSLLHGKGAPPDYARFIRRETKRDSWITAATKGLLADGYPATSRLVWLKNAIASELGSSRSIWMLGERPPDGDSRKDLEDIEFTLGFKLPKEKEVLVDGKSKNPVPGPNEPHPDLLKGTATDSELQFQDTLIGQAKAVLRQSEDGGMKKARADRSIVESWNLADTEIWKFVRAWNARKRIERRGWEEDEERFLGKGMFARWRDHLMDH